MRSITAEWRGSVTGNRGNFAGPRAGYSGNGDHYAQQQDSSAQGRYAVCCCGADGCGYPLQGSTPQQQQQQQPRDSGEFFHSSTLHKLQQLGLYTNMDTPDTAHQLDAEVVFVEVAYTMTNTQPSCWVGGEMDRIPNTFKEVTNLPQAAR